jgi:hypothetical protein
LEVARQAIQIAGRPPVSQTALQDLSTESRRGHPLAVHGVERASRVAGNEEPLGPPGQSVVMPEAVLGVSIASDGSERFGVAEPLGKLRGRQTGGELVEASLVGRRVILVAAAEGH